MITLFQYKPQYGLPNASPFCMKVETYLRLAGLDYTTSLLHDPRKAPKGKLPYITDGKLTIADSTFIIRHLNGHYGIDLNAGLSDADKAMAHAWQVMLEERLYWVMAYSRWIDERCWPVTREVFFGHLPPLVNQFVPKLVRDTVRKQLEAQGIGRHAADDIYALGQMDLLALATFLGTKPFMMGDTVSELDAVAYAFVANCVVPPLESPLRAAARSHANLVAYVERMRQRCFP